MRLIYSFFISIFVLIQIVYAQNWHSIGPAGIPLSICVSSKYILAGTEYAGIAKSTDNGITWKFVQGIPVGNTPNNAIMCIVHDPQNLENVYAGTGPDETATGNGFFKSTDGGETWKAENTGLGRWPAIRQISINPFHSNDIYSYCLSNAGHSIYESTDYGKLWNLFYYVQDVGSLCSTVVFNERDSTVKYAFNGNGTIYQWKDTSFSKITTSTDFFTTASPIKTFLNSKTDSFFYVTMSNVYKRTLDSDWVSKLSNHQTDSLAFNNIINADIDQTNGIIYVSTDEGLLTSSDDGESWSINADMGNKKVKVDSSNIILTGFKGIYLSADSRNQWNKLSNGLNISSVNRSSIVYKAGKLTIYLLGNDNSSTGILFKTTDEGNSWIKIKLPNQILPSVIEANPYNPNILYLGGIVYSGGAFSSDLYKSYDGGINWESVLSNTEVNDIEIFPNDTSHILIGSKGKILESFNSGNSWGSYLTDLNSSYYQVNIIKVSSKNPSVVCAAVSGNTDVVTGFFISTT